MFENNIKELKKKNPELAKKLVSMTEEDIKDIEVFESESKNIIISYKGYLLHSNEDPIREAKSIWHKTISDDLTDKDIQIIYGLGLGYLFKRAYINANSRILLYEPSLDILRFVFEHVDFSQELSDDRVQITNNEDDFLKHFESKYLMGDKVEVLFLPSYLSFHKNEMLNFSEKIYQIVKDKGIDQKTIAHNAKLAVKNFISRINRMDRFSIVDALENKFENKTALILSAGPSLSEHIETIKANKDKYLTIAILPVAQLLIENGIEPDFIVVADPRSQMHKIKNIKNKLKNINFVMESRSDTSLDELETRSKLIYFPNVDKVAENILSKSQTPQISLRKSVPSVAILAYELAKTLGCKDIVFVGLDLAIIDEKIYAKETKISIDGSRMHIYNELGSQRCYVTKVKSVDGGEVLTREDYIVFINEFEKAAKQSGDCTLYNTSTKGAYIDGMTYTSLSDINSKLKQNSVDINSITDKAIEENKDTCDKFSVASQSFFKTEKQLIEEHIPNLSKSIDAILEILEILESQNPDLNKFKEIFNKNLDNFSKSRQLVTKNLLMATYLQSEVMDYLKNYSRDENMTIPKLISNFKADLQLFTAAKDCSSVIIPLIKDKKTSNT